MGLFYKAPLFPRLGQLPFGLRQWPGGGGGTACQLGGVSAGGGVQ